MTFDLKTVTSWLNLSCETREFNVNFLRFTDVELREGMEQVCPSTKQVALRFAATVTRGSTTLFCAL